MEFNHNSNTLIDTLDKTIIEKILKLSDDDLDIVLGRWDFSIGMAIEEVKRESIEGKDSVDKILEKRKESEEKSVKYCENGHRNEKP